MDLHYLLTNIFVLLHIWSLQYSILGRRICFCNCLYALSYSHKYFAFHNHVHCFKSIIPDLFFVCQTYCFFIYASNLLKFYTPVYLKMWVSIYMANAYEMLRVSHKYITFGSHVSSLKSRIS